ncbi:MAG: family 16 glycoside hydrolase [Planctomycetota bacterium]|jgi:hypothetical protein
MVRSYIHTRPYSIGAIIVVVVLAGALAVGSAGELQTEEAGGNGKCYVCHPIMKTEELTTSHLEMGVTCDTCHGASTEHMHDEMLMTKPDLLFGRSQVRKMCSNPTCHKSGGDRELYGRQDHMDIEAVEAFFEKWTGRMRPNGRNITPDSICTDCHGTHNISEPQKAASEDEQPQWLTLFNGRDLKGWRHSDGDSWSVRSGRIVGAGGVLWTEESYEDYLLAMTFRASWPIHAGIWSRGEGSPRVEIFESGPAFTGSVSVPGKGLALVNLHEDFEDRESWNTISIKVEGDRTQVWLNGEEIGVVRAAGPVRGRIGLYVSESEDSKRGQLVVREVLIQKLVKSEE